MIVFTVLGVLVFWWLMGCIGYGLGMFLDFRRGIHRWSAAVDDHVREFEALVFAITAMASKP